MLYVARPVKNAGEIADWFKAQGMNTIDPADMHVTIVFSKRQINWAALPCPDDYDYEMEPAFRRSVKSLGDKGATVMTIKSDELHSRWAHFISKGASWDWDGYQPHITVSYDAKTNPERFVAFPGCIGLGPEQWKLIDPRWVG